MRLAISILLLAASAFAQTYDLVVYGATAGGVMTAVAASRQGLKTVLLEPGTHVGGMATSGLSRTDVGKREVIGGLALEFYYRVGERYGMRRFNNPLAWFYEPHVGEEVMFDMLKDAGVTVLFHHRLREKNGVKKEGTKIVSIFTDDGSEFAAKVFADCSYEGDLTAQAGVSYTWGRESSSQYAESLAGVRERTPYHQFLIDIPARDEKGNVLPEISTEPRGQPGSADKKVQAYNFRVIATNDPANRLPWPKPANYNAARYELLARYLEALPTKLGRDLVFYDVALISLIPNHKADINNMGPFSTDYIGGSYDYPNATYAQREKIWQQHADYVQGFFYFLASDARVPKSLQSEVREWGLPRDEFADSNHWPHQLYVREARRMVGDFVATQKDLQTDLLKSDAIGMGSYNSDSHNVQRIINEHGFVENEGDMQVPVTPYQIPYRAMLPKRSEATNLLIPVCFSASHVAYSSLRMEPQYMILGHAAGVAAALAVRGDKSVQDVPVAELQKLLKDQGAIFHYQRTEQNDALDKLREQMKPKGPERLSWE